MSGRDPKRIPEVLAALGELWMECPDLRLGQIMGNAAITFYTEDDRSLTEIRQWRDYYRERRSIVQGISKPTT
ncbi:hypothetical protein PV761_03325 [Arthrobacter sp. CC3]|uniref:hypothetical protein n=1 Tax=Arthrobacter sp. CC3 TaxID=3029185 RepID=UPI003265986F